MYTKKALLGSLSREDAAARPTYGTMYGMNKTTIYLPEDLKRKVETAAKLDGSSEAEIIRQAVEEAMRKRVPPRPRIPLTTKRLPKPDMAENFDEYLKGFGR